MAVRLGQFFRRPRVGLALGAGGARGWAHIGIIRELEDAGIPIDVITGTSSGAIVGAFHASGALDALERFAATLRSLRHTLAYMELSFGGNGIVGGKKIIRWLGDHLPIRNFEDLKIPLGLVAADLMTMSEIQITGGALIPAIRASAAFPGFLVPEETHAFQLVDGGLVNPIPVNLARKLGADVVIAVDLYEPPLCKKARGASGVLNRSVELMQLSLLEANLRAWPPDVLLRPELDGHGFLDHHRNSPAIAAGRRAARSKMPDIQRMLRSPFFGLKVRW